MRPQESLVGDEQAEATVAKQIKIPKRIAGIKIPKSIRKGPIAAFLNTSAGQMLLAQAVLAIGAVSAARREDPNAPLGDTLRHPLERIRALLGEGGVQSEVFSSRDRLGRAFRAALQAFQAEYHDDPKAQERSDADDSGSEAVRAAKKERASAAASRHH
jgi:hypothetical protein